jgi:G3E family GTPase
VHAAGQLERHAESRKQVALADRLVLTKTDLSTPADVASLRAELARLNPAAPIVVADTRALDAEALLGQDVFHETGKVDEVGRWLRAAEQRRYFPVHRGNPNLHGDIRAFVLEPGEAIDWSAFSLWLSLLLHRHGEQVLRVKGLLQVDGAETPVAIHGVQRLMHPPQHLARWPEGLCRSAIVFIVQGLEPARVIASWRGFHQRLTD